MSDFVDRLYEAVEALERFRDARNDVMGNYAGEGMPSALEGLQAPLRAGSRRLNEVIDELRPYQGGKVKTVAEVQLTGDDLFPDAIRQAYTFLYSTCYGSSGSFFGDPNSEDIVPQEWFTKSEQQQTRGPAKQGSRKYASSVKTIIKNERALELKKRIDKRLRKLAKDIYAEWEGNDLEETLKCWSCHKIAQREWKHCPRCGDRLVK